MPREFFSSSDVADILGVSADAACALIRRLPHVIVGKQDSKKPRRIIRREVFYGWLAQQDGYEPDKVPLRAVRGGKA